MGSSGFVIDRLGVVLENLYVACFGLLSCNFEVGDVGLFYYIIIVSVLVYLELVVTYTVAHRQVEILQLKVQNSKLLHIVGLLLCLFRIKVELLSPVPIHPVLLHTR